MRSSDSSISIGASSGQQRCDDDLCERGVPAVRRVERRLAHEAMHAALGLQRAVRVLALDRHRGRLEARLLARARLDRLGLEAAVGGPAQVQPQEHVGPVLGVRSTRARVDLEDGVARVVLAVEQRVLLQTTELALERRDELRDLLLVLAEREQLRRVLELALEPLVALELADEPRVLGGDASRTRLVVPEPGSPHRLLELDASRC